MILIGLNNFNVVMDWFQLIIRVYNIKNWFHVYNLIQDDLNAASSSNQVFSYVYSNEGVFCDVMT